VDPGEGIKIFSYARKDDSELVRQMYQGLTASGFEACGAFVDQNRILAGDGTAGIYFLAFEE